MFDSEGRKTEADLTASALLVAVNDGESRVAGIVPYPLDDLSPAIRLSLPRASVTVT